jgi:hypothetical protein
VGCTAQSPVKRSSCPGDTCARTCKGRAGRGGGRVQRGRGPPGGGVKGGGAAEARRQVAGPPAVRGLPLAACRPRKLCGASACVLLRLLHPLPLLCQLRRTVAAAGTQQPAPPRAPPGRAVPSMQCQRCGTVRAALCQQTWPASAPAAPPPRRLGRLGRQPARAALRWARPAPVGWGWSATRAASEELAARGRC